MKVLIRCDSTVDAGTGHVMRCLALAQVVCKQGGTATFISAAQAKGVLERLEEGQHECVPLDLAPGSVDDARATAEVARRLKVDSLVVDGYGFDDEYLRQLHEAGMDRVVLIDDYAHAPNFGGSMLINQNSYAAADMYPHFGSRTKMLLGTRFALLRKEFWKRRSQRAISAQGRRVLVTLGGCDAENVTLKILRALEALRDRQLEISVVAGSANPHADELCSACSGLPRVNLLKSVANMRELMEWADICICAGGGTCWELLYLGLPCVLVILAENQERIAMDLDRRKAGVLLGWHDRLHTGDVAACVASILDSCELRSAMSHCGQALVDGFGALRVHEALRGGRVLLRRVEEADCALYFEWLNSPPSLVSAMQAGPVAWKSHRAWFERQLADPATYMYVGHGESDLPVGLVRFRMEGQDALVDLWIAVEARGQSLARELLEQGLRFLGHEGAWERAVALVKVDNHASCRIFEQCGFSNSGRVWAKSCSFFRMIRPAEAAS